MTEPVPELAVRAICRELSERGRSFALVGGLAVSVRAEIRFTRDVDIAVGVTDDATERGFHRDQDLEAKLESVLAV